MRFFHKIPTVWKHLRNFYFIIFVVENCSRLPVYNGEGGGQCGYVGVQPTPTKTPRFNFSLLGGGNA